MCVEMGIPEVRARKGLLATGNASVEAALDWAFEHAGDPGIDDPQLGGADEGFESSMGGEEAGPTFKMVLAVRGDLQMSPGKVAAQCCHACLGIYRRLIQLSARDETFAVHGGSAVIPRWEAIARWENSGEVKVVLSAPDMPALQQLEEGAVSRGLASYLVQDAGHTQVAPGSQTVLAIFGATEQVDQVTGHLKLY